MGLDGRSQRNFPKHWTGLTAAGNSQTTAFLLDNGVYHEFTSVGSGQGCVLPVPVELPREITISNNGANVLLVYPQVGGTIDNGSANASVSVAAGNSVTYWPTSFTNWQSRVTAGTGGGGGSSTITEVSQTASFTATAGSFYAISGSATVTAALPTAVGIAGQTIRIRCASGYTGLCTITGTSGQTIGRATSQIIYAGESPLLQSDGANWVRTGGTIIPCVCQLSLSTSQTIANSTDTIVAFDAVALDNTGMIAVTAAHELKVFRPGNYLVSCGGQYGGLTNQNYSIYVIVNKNGVNTTAYDQRFITAPNPLLGGFTLNGSSLLNLVAGDLLVFHTSQTNTAASSALFINTYAFLQLQELLSW